jgi:hypothetical protein
VIGRVWCREWRSGCLGCQAIYMLVLAVTFSVGCTQIDRATPRAHRTKIQDPVRITQFYATKPALPRGEEALLCYGVENATAVRLTPAIESIWPALSRCVTISPAKTTTFTLVAEGHAAKTTSQSVTVTVTEPLPRFTDLSISAKEVPAGEVVAFCFKATDAVAVRGKPGYFQLGGSPQSDCLVNQPRHTTLYRITIEGAGGQTDDASITVRVR